MRYGKLLYLILAVLLFIILIIPIFQNLQYQPFVTYFKYMSFINMYKIAMPLCMVEGALITLYVRSLIVDMTRQGAKKFDLKD